MILYMCHKAEGKRGGELTNEKIHSFMKKCFSDVVPNKLYQLPSRASHPVMNIIYSIELVKKYRPNLLVVDISSGCRNIWAVRWMKKHQRKVMVILLGKRMAYRYDNLIVKTIVGWCEGYLLKNADIVLVNSEFSAMLAKKKTSENAQIVVNRPGLEFHHLPSGNDMCAENNDSSSISLLFVGECTKVKGLKFLIQALNLLNNLDVHLNIVGEYNVRSKYFKELNDIIVKGSLQDRVNFHGFVEHNKLIEFYRKSMIFVLPSLSEGFGKVLAEALCFGLPVVASKAGAIPEMVVDGVNAILVKPGDSQALAEALRTLILDRDLREKMSRTNLERSKTLPQWDDFDRVLETRLAFIIENLTGLKPG